MYKLPLEVQNQNHMIYMPLWCLYDEVTHIFFICWITTEQMLHAVSLLFCGLFSQYYQKHNRRYTFLMLLVKLYAPYAFFKGWWDPISASVP
jgi:hypothetical protein